MIAELISQLSPALSAPQIYPAGGRGPQRSQQHYHLPTDALIDAGYANLSGGLSAAVTPLRPTRVAKTLSGRLEICSPQVELARITTPEPSLF
jgi:hypothetical protein